VVVGVNDILPFADTEYGGSLLSRSQNGTMNENISWLEVSFQIGSFRLCDSESENASKGSTWKTLMIENRY